MHAPTWLLCCERILSLVDQVGDARKRRDLSEVCRLRAQIDSLKWVLESGDYTTITDIGMPGMQGRELVK